MKPKEIGGEGGSHGRQGREATALAVEKLAKGDSRREMEEARAAEELCCLGLSEEDGLPARRQIPDKSGFVYL